VQIGDAVGEFVEQLGDHVLNGGTAIRFGTYLARISPGTQKMASELQDCKWSRLGSNQ